MNSSDAQKVLSADLINIVKKVQDGKPLTSRERTIIEHSSRDISNEYTVKELAEKLSISSVTYYEWRKDENAPKTRNYEEWNAYKIKRQTLGKESGRKYSTGQLADLKGKLLAEKTLRETAERKLKEIQLRREQEGWVPLADAQSHITRVLEPLSRLLDSTPRAYAMRMNPADPEHAETILREMVRDIKTQLQSERGESIHKRKGTK